MIKTEPKYRTQYYLRAAAERFRAGDSSSPFHHDLLERRFAAVDRFAPELRLLLNEMRSARLRPHERAEIWSTLMVAFDDDAQKRDAAPDNFFDALSPETAARLTKPLFKDTMREAAFRAGWKRQDPQSYKWYVQQQRNAVGYSAALAASARDAAAKPSVNSGMAASGSRSGGSYRGPSSYSGWASGGFFGSGPR